MSKRFRQQNSVVVKKLGTRWRKPRGLQSKLRIAKAGSGKKPTVGYQTAKQEKDTILVNGKRLYPVLVRNARDLDRVTERQVIVFASQLGRKKIMDLEKIISEKKLNMLYTKKLKHAKFVQKKSQEKKKQKSEKKEEKSVKEKPDEKKV